MSTNLLLRMKENIPPASRKETDETYITAGVSQTKLWTTHPATKPLRTRATKRNLTRPPLTAPGCPTSNDSSISNNDRSVQTTQGKGGTIHGRQQRQTPSMASLQGKPRLHNGSGVKLLATKGSQIT